MNGILILLALGLVALNGGDPVINNPKENTDIVMEVGPEKIPMNEFEAIFSKNNSEENIDKEYLDDYTKLFVDFRRKVLYAQELKLDTSAAFIAELAGYRTQLAKPYLTDKVAEEKLVAEAYDRTKYEVRASHILIQLKEGASEQEANAALNKINSLRSKIVAGEDFAEIAKANSQDPSAADNGGDLGYFSAFKMVYPFESAAFNTKVGQVSQPFLTQFGYHILKVVDKRSNRGEVKVAHIMIEERDDVTKEEVIANQDKLKQLRESLNNGISFDEMVKFSDDKGSKNKNGELPWFGAGQMVPEFEDAAFALQNTGDISKPVKTMYGWHVLKLIDKRDVPSFEDAKADIERKIKRDVRGDGGRVSLIASIKKDNDFADLSAAKRSSFNKQSNSSFGAKTTSTNRLAVFHNVKLNKDFNAGNNTLFRLARENYTQDDFLSYIISSKTRVNQKFSASAIDKLYNEWLDQSCIDYEDSQLENKYSEFKALMKEYHDGIMLFDLMDQKVWSKAISDTVGLLKYFDLTRENYTEVEHAKTKVYTSRDAKISSRLRQILNDRSNLELLTKEEINRLRFGKGDDRYLSDDQLLTVFNSTSPNNLKISNKKFLKGENTIVDKKWSEGFTENDLQLDGSFVFYYISEVKSGGLKSFEDAKGQVISDYQNYLEENWKKELSKKYPVIIYEDVLYTILK